MPFIPDRNLLAKFLENVVKSDQCWEWIGTKFPSGYGRFYMRGKSLRANRASWEIYRGPIPENLIVCHHCDNPGCVRPSHLFLGTHSDNKQDCVTKGRHARGKKLSLAFKARVKDRGVNINTAKLSESDVLAIRSKYVRGRGPYDPGNSAKLAVKYGVSPAEIRYIARGLFWKHVK